MKALHRISVIGTSVTLTAALAILPIGTSPAAGSTIEVTSTADAGAGTLREAITAANAAKSISATSIVFKTTGTITLASALPVVTSPVVLDGTQLPHYSAAGGPAVGVNFANNSGLVFGKGSAGSSMIALSLVASRSAGVTIQDDNVTLSANYIGLAVGGEASPNAGDGVLLTSNVNGAQIGSNTGNIAGYYSNVISANGGNGIRLEGASRNTIAANRIGTNPAGTSALPNAKNGIVLTQGSSNNLIGGRVGTDSTGASNDPTGSEGKVTPVFVVPPQGNLVSGNTANGIYIIKASNSNTIAGNFVGTDATGQSAVGNGGAGIYVKKSDNNVISGCTANDVPFLYYNVTSGNQQWGITIGSGNNNVIQGNFSGIGARNNVMIPNGYDGIEVHGTSKNTQIGGVIPLGNVSSGNTLNGVAVDGSASGTVVFNSFSGIYAFGGAAPNGANGLLATARGGNNLIRTSVFGGNAKDGIHIGGKATGFTIDPVIVGMNTVGTQPIPNGKNGITVTGSANHNTIGGSRRSVMPSTTISGNTGYGIYITKQAHHNKIIWTHVGTEILGVNAAPNGLDGLRLAGKAHDNIIGTKAGSVYRSNIFSGNAGNGVTLGGGTRDNKVRFNIIGRGTSDIPLPNGGLAVLNSGTGNIIKHNELYQTP